ncbi:MAG: Na/Pi symporter, partial [Bdellovibrionaceae bacterium]|nr:Na/Pi symporter [Pseudobdellovibrionaceae bacterium]
MIDLGNSYFALLIGGVALFLYGMMIASNALEKLMSGRITGLMTKLSTNQFLAIVTGVSLTTLLQSSGAVTSMLVGLGSARVVTLRQVMGVIIGAAIGSTITVQLISLDISSFALPVFAVAFFVYFQAKKPGIKNISLVLMGFALLFIGMKTISLSAHHFA